MPKRREPLERKLLRELVRCDGDLELVALRVGMKLEELAAWGASERGRGLTQGMRYMEDIRVQFLVSRHRVVAAGKLIELINERDWPTKERETLRRSCAELLRLSIVGDAKTTDLSAANPKPETLVDDEELLAALRCLGGEHTGEGGEG